MPPASATQKLKAEKGLSRASSVSKTEPESPTDSTENSYLKELQKTLRNANKKLNASAKVDTILAENPGKTLDQLIEEKKINQDQKAQLLKKPTLQATVAQAEEQIAHYKQFASQYEERLTAQKAELTKAHEEELEAVRGNAIADATETSKTALRQQLHTLTKFLCGAATLRRDGDANDTESQAFEGVLFQVYGGSQEAVNSMVKIIDGVDEKIATVEGNLLDFTYADVKQACDRFAPVEEDSDCTTETIPASDPTLANAASTELQDTSLSNTAPKSSQAELAPPQTLVSDAANPVAEKSSGAAETVDSDWVELPRNPAETETGLQATPASADAGLTNGSVGADVAGAQENGAKKSNGRRRHQHSRSQREGQQPREGQAPREGKQAQREGQKAQREGEGQREGQAPRDGQRGRGRGPRGEGRGRGGRGRGRGANGNSSGHGSAEASAPTPAAASA